MVSGGRGPDQNLLFLDRRGFSEGAVILSLSGNLEVETMVAQGCRPFGQSGRVTRAEGGQLCEIERRPALQFLRDQLNSLSKDELQLVQRAPLFLGVAMDPFQQTAPRPGDYLIRNVIGVDPGKGVLAVHARIPTGATVQFHLRDGDASHDDLCAVLDTAKHRNLAPPAGALLFSCLGRGRHLFGVPDHDSALFQQVIGPTPLGGFFCNGEIGPVQDATYLHSYTSSFAVFRAKTAAGLPG
jgi:small ligand-binding sensory domain FIST